MDLIDIREKDGPYWAAYQAERERSGILDNPSMVPPWFLAKTACARLAAARVELERAAEPRDDHARSVFEALRVVEQFVRTTVTLDPAAAAVVAGLLGAQEIETERERREAAEATR